MTKESVSVVDRLENLRLDIDAIKYMARQNEDLWGEMNDVIYDLEEKFTRAEEKYRELFSEKSTSWDRVQLGFDYAWQEAEYAIDRAKARFLH